MQPFTLAAVRKRGDGWEAYALDVETGKTLLLGTFSDDSVADAVADTFIEGLYNANKGRTEEEGAE